MKFDLKITNADLSKDLSKLSGWQDFSARWCWAKEHPQNKPELVRAGTPVWTWWPAYELDFMLNKLKDYGHFVNLRYYGGRWICDDGNFGTGQSDRCAADAVALLAAKLHEEKHLRKEVMA